MKKTLLTLFLLISFSGFAQKLDSKKQYSLVCVGFYNLENLFDTIVDPDTNKILQEDFTPHGPKVFTSQRYQEKLQNLAKVIADMGTETTPDGPAVLGVCEIENQQVLEDLVQMPAIKERNYKIVHYESPDRRGIDVGLLYQEKYFKPSSSRSITLRMKDDPDFKTRDQLLVSGQLDGEEIHFMVAHWPSRRGGEKRSRPKREAAADLGRSVIDSIRQVNPNAKVIYMGDLNDDPINSSVKKHMMAVGKVEKMSEDKLFNPMEEKHSKEGGTLAYRNAWNLFDQMILTPALITRTGEYDTYKYFKATILRKPYMFVKEGSFKGYPLRSYVGTTWQGGYSDHLPVYLYLIKEKQ